MWNKGLFMPQTKPLSWSLMALSMICILVLTKKSLPSKSVKKTDCYKHPINKKWMW